MRCIIRVRRDKPDGYAYKNRLKGAGLPLKANQESEYRPMPAKSNIFMIMVGCFSRGMKGSQDLLIRIKKPPECFREVFLKNQ
ncbi:hypothetical protein [Persicobacter diffluens]|uniref:Uncharacterized protein n=1 Tax=Persicobacter diffluens TaxID=981 RepID=A0AAN4VUA2_9BACT|nr:hypothetical protein PEDI_00790 [Persicobacter diffluens]